MAEYVALAFSKDNESSTLAARETLAQCLVPLEIPADALSNAQDHATLRLAFKPASMTLIAQVKNYGSDRLGNAPVVYCPIAFDCEDADWISQEPEILNPCLARKC